MLNLHQDLVFSGSRKQAKVTEDEKQIAQSKLDKKKGMGPIVACTPLGRGCYNVVTICVDGVNGL